MPRCEFTKSNREPCKAIALTDEKFCLFHSQSKKARNARAGKKELTIEDRIIKLTKQSRRIESDKKISESERAKIMLQLYNKIDEYEKRLKKGKDKPTGDEGNGGEELTFEEKIKRVQEKEIKGEAS